MALTKLLTKLSGPDVESHICNEAGPDGYGRHRQVTSAGLATALVVAGRRDVRMVSWYDRSAICAVYSLYRAMAGNICLIVSLSRERST